MHSKNDVVSGVKWVSVSTFGRRILALLANIVLARLLAPADFGLVAMAAVVLGFIEIFKDLGTGSAIIRQKDISEQLVSSIFWFNIGFGALATVAAIALAPLIADFYHEPRVTAVLQAMSISFLLSAMAIVQSSLLARQMEFAKVAKIELAAATISYVVGIGAALLGHGVWSLVYQVLINSVLTLVLIWLASSWRPSLSFSWQAVKSVMHYSLNLTAYNIFYYFASNVDNLLIGRFLGSQELGYYDLAYRLMSFPLQAISAVFGRVMTPFYAQAQDNLVRFREAFLHVAVAIAFITFPLMLGLFATREHFVLSVFGPSWSPVILLLALFAPLGAIRSVLTTTGSIYQAMGAASLQLHWGIASNLIVIAALALGVHWGSVGVAAAFSISSILLLYHNFKIPLRLIGLPLRELVRALQPTLYCSILMYAMIFAVDAVLPRALPQAALLAFTVATGVASYLTFTWWLNRALFHQVLAMTGLAKPQSA
jgi:O-antigen/teichoic acid export membrane protein